MNNKKISRYLSMVLVSFFLVACNWNEKEEKEKKYISFYDYLLTQTNDKSVQKYEDGDKTKMYYFEHNDTEQVKATYDYRYIGKNPNNYLEFNCNQSTEDCEIWKIIGLFNINGEEYVKIIDESSIGEYSWDWVPQREKGYNNWEKSSLNQMLNYYYLGAGKLGKYYDQHLDKIRYFSFNVNTKMIDSVPYYLGGDNYNSNSKTGDDIYAFERGTEVYDGNPIKWTGKVGLMYLSDYVYTFAKGVDDICYNNLYQKNDCNYRSTWLYSSYEEWTITPVSSYNDLVFFVNMESDRLFITRSDYMTMYISNIRPVVYLNSHAKYVEGDGSRNNPYKIIYQE